MGLPPLATRCQADVARQHGGLRLSLGVVHPPAMLSLLLARGTGGLAWTGESGSTVGVLPVAPQHLHEALALRVGAPPRASLQERVRRCASTLAETAGVWTESVRRAPLRTAWTLLREVDALALHGARVDDLPPPLASRLGVTWGCDRPDAWLDAVTRAVTTSRLLGQVSCLAQRATLPTRVQELLAVLEAHRWTVIPAPVPGVCPPVLHSTGHTPLELAHGVAARIAQEAPISVAVIAPTVPLAAAWERQGLPSLGEVETNTLAISWLRTLLALARSPDDVERVRALIEHPWSHVPRVLRRALVDALATWPSHRAGPWREAIRRARDSHDTPEAAAAGALDALVGGGVASPDDLRRCWQQFAGALPDTDGARLMADTLDVLAPLAPASIFDPHIDDAVAFAASAFHPTPRWIPGAGAVALAHPGAVLAPVDQLIVWGASALEPPPDVLDHLGAPARDALRQRGVELPTRAEHRRAFLQDLLHAIAHTRTRVWLCDSVIDDAGDPRRLGALVPWLDATLRSQGHRGVRQEVPAPSPSTGARAAPRARRRWSHRDALPQRTESPSSVATLLGCSLRHTLRYHAKLREEVDTSLPQGPLLAGRIAHEVIAQSLLPHGNPEVVATRAASAVDAFIQGHAPSLCLPASRPVRHHLRVSTARTGALLAEMCADIPQGVFTEHSLRPSAALGPVRLRGRADIIVREPATVLDLKWSAAGHRRALAEGTALQLALYAWALREAQGGAWPTVGYVIVDEATAFVSGPSPLRSVRGVRGGEIARTVEAARRALLRVIDARADGTSVAEGVAEGDMPVRVRDELVGDELRVTPGCRYCAFDALCGRAWTEVSA